VRRRIEVLFDQLLDSLARRDVTPMVNHAESVAEERFNAGYDLSEIKSRSTRSKNPSDAGGRDLGT
jgi:hypothetical protein